VIRAGLVTLALSAVLAGLLAAGAFGSAKQWSRADADTITLRARLHDGIWQKSLSLKLNKLKLIGFTVCAVWDQPATQKFSCKGPAGAKLPAGTRMRLEQSPVSRALRRADSPGWGMLGTSEDPFLGAGLSNTVSGNRIGTVKYRVTLRDASEKIMLTSNVFTVVWHR
jgi:hypothetical protein